MSYQVLARKWRPQRFDEVVGQQAVTRTLRNAIASGRIAQAFVFAGSRGCGKTTTARILARALNCINGPTGDPCGACDACVEIAQGRDMDVLEIDAASHTQVDNIREVILSGLAVAPVRDRYKVFIIDEVHQLSSHSFNALLKSIEEPPAHVVFMMATTELHKIPDTILSRSQVFEFKAISTPAIAAQLRRIADAERIEVPDAALALVARAAEGSMRDAQSALDQVMAFAGQAIGVDDVATVLGLVGRDLLLDLVQAVVDEDAPRAFALADRAVEAGHDLRLVLRELTRVVRDLMVLSVDPARAGDGELADDERARLVEMAVRFSREDLMRAFDLLGKAEQDIRTASHPRYHFEMVLLRWMHLRKLVPLADLIEQLGGGRLQQPVPGKPRLAAASPSPTTVSAPARPGAPVQQAAPVGRLPRVTAAAPQGDTAPAPQGTASAPQAGTASAPQASSVSAPQASSVSAPQASSASAPQASSASAPQASTASAPQGPAASARRGSGTSPATPPAPPADSPAAIKDALLGAIRAGKPFFYNTVVAQAQKIEVAGDRVTFTFLPTHRALREQFEQSRAWLEAAAERAAGRRITIDAVQAEGGAAPPAAAAEQTAEGRRDLKAEAMSSSAVQAMLDVFPAEIRDVEEM